MPFNHIGIQWGDDPNNMKCKCGFEDHKDYWIGHIQDDMPLPPETALVKFDWEVGDPEDFGRESWRFLVFRTWKPHPHWEITVAAMQHLDTSLSTFGVHVEGGSKKDGGGAIEDAALTPGDTQLIVAALAEAAAEAEAIGTRLKGAGYRIGWGDSEAPRYTLPPV